MPISSIWKRDFPFFGLVMGTSGKQCQYLLFKNGISVVFFGLWWEPLENNANIVYLKTGFRCLFGLFWKIMPISSIWKRDFLFFWACDGNLWKIMPISSIWKRNFRVFFWACDGNLIWKRDFPFFGLVMGTSGKKCQYLLFENGISLFWACDGNLWKIMPISSIWKRDFPFLGLWWEPGK